MSKKRYIIKSGMLGQFANGKFFITGYNKNTGHILYPIDRSNPFIVSDEYESDTKLLHDDDNQYDIVKLWSVNPLSFMQITPENVDEFINVDHPDSQLEWTNPKYQPKKSAPGPDSMTAPVNNLTADQNSDSEITVRTSIEIAINDEIVDLNNLTEYQSIVLKKFGVI